MYKITLKNEKTGKKVTEKIALGDYDFKPIAHLLTTMKKEVDEKL